MSRNSARHHCLEGELKLTTTDIFPGTQPTAAETLKKSNAETTMTSVPERRSDSRSDKNNDSEQDPNTLTYLRPPMAAKFIGVAVSTLARWRVEGNGPKFCRPGGKRFVLYSKADLIDWLEANKRQSTSEGGI